PRVMGASGAESFNVAAYIFIGQTDVPLTIRPVQPVLTRSELLTEMTSGMAHAAGGILADYIYLRIVPKFLLIEANMTSLGTLFAPVAWIIGVPRQDCGAIGSLLGTRMVLNELVAFSQLGPQKAMLDPRSFTIATFALCGFANLSSIGIQIGGIGALAPNKRGELARLGLRAMLAGTMANLMSASIAGMLL